MFKDYGFEIIGTICILGFILIFAGGLLISQNILTECIKQAQSIEIAKLCK